MLESSPSRRLNIRAIVAVRRPTSKISLMSMSQPVMPLTTLTICEGEYGRKWHSPTESQKCRQVVNDQCSSSLFSSKPCGWIVWRFGLYSRIRFMNGPSVRADGVVHVVHVVGAGRGDHVAHAERVLDARLVERELLALDVVDELHRAPADLLGRPVGALGQQVAERVRALADRLDHRHHAVGVAEVELDAEVVLRQEALLERLHRPGDDHAGRDAVEAERGACARSPWPARSGRRCRSCCPAPRGSRTRGRRRSGRP